MTRPVSIIVPTVSAASSSGEQQALGLLRDYSRTYSERFDGFIVRRFNGDQVTTAGGEVRPL